MKKLKFTALIFLLISFFLLLGTLPFPNNSSQDEIKRINQQIRLEGLDWKAGETSLADLLPEERKQRLGAFRPLYIDPEKLLSVPSYPALPNQIDWRDTNNRNYMTSIKDQGNCGSCWAFAACGAVEARYNTENNLYSPSLLSSWENGETSQLFVKIANILNIGHSTSLNYPDLSEQDLISCSNAGDCNGGYAWMSFDYMETTGIVSEDCFPYQANDIPCHLCSNWNEKLFKIGDWGWVTGNYVDKYAIKNSLQNGPLVFFMEVYSDFYYYTSGIYEKTVGASYEGGHLVVLVGYDEFQDYWICKNSWGLDWGEDGYFRIRMGECEGGKWVLKAWNVLTSNNPPEIHEIPDKTVKEGQELSFYVTASDPDEDTLTFSCPNLPDGASFNSSSGLFSWTPSYTQSGEYQLKFSVTDGMSESSTTANITVINVKRGIGRF